jgi:hypothetical protein
MNCEALREALAADPTRSDEELERHVADCVPCRAFRARLLSAELLIGKALRFDVHALARGARAAPPSSRISRRVASFSIAAAVALGALSLRGLSGGGVQLSNAQLAREAVLHWYREPESWVRTNRSVAPAVLTVALDGAAEVDRAGLMTISFAKSCRIGPGRVPHLVVQGTQGPYMVLLFAGRRLDQPVPLELPAEGLTGHIVPAGTGSIAVLGVESSELAEVEAAVSSAVDWST